MLEAKWLMDTPLIVTQDMSEADLQIEAEKSMKRAIMTQHFIDGRIDVETFFDFMAEQGYEPAELLEQAEENLQFVIKEGIAIEK